MNKLYANRKLAQGHPDLARSAFKKYTSLLDQQIDIGSRAELLLKRLDRLVNASELKNMLVLGCGPRPEVIEVLIQNGINAIGVEPVASFVHAAREYLGSPERILEGSAEEIPLPDNSQNLVICESVLEHVDSPTKSLDEIFRILTPGGVVYVVTTNRHWISPTGENGEFNVRYFNWLPDIIKESFVFQHLHYNPSLANHTMRPAVHWYSYADLCKLGRQAGFHQFYSILDLLEPGDPAVTKSKIRSLLLSRLQFNPWLRALTLTQFGGIIFMLKRR